MNTYFIRYTWKLNIDAATRKRLIEDGLVVHSRSRWAGWSGSGGRGFTRA